MAEDVGPIGAYGALAERRLVHCHRRKDILWLAIPVTALPTDLA